MAKRYISVKYSLRTNRGTQSNRPIYCRIYANGKEIRFTTEFECSEQIWNQSKQRTEPPTELNELIARHEMGIHKAYDLSVKNGYLFTPDFIKRFMAGNINNEKSTFYDFAITWLKENSNRLKLETVKQLQSDIMKLERFRPKIALHEIDKTLILEYERHLTQTLKNNPNTVQRSMKKIKMFIGHAIRAGHIKENPFEGIKFKGTIPTDIKAITENDIENLEKLRFTSYRMAETRDIFLLQCYTGMAYADVKTLTPDHIIETNGKKWISKDRKKSDIAALIPIFPKTEKILDNLNFFEIGKIRIAANQTYNYNLKKIGKAAKIENLTSHVARKTCGMILLNNGVSIEAVSRILGHTSIKTTQKFYAKARAELIAKETEKFKLFG